MAFVKARIEIRPASTGTGIKASLRKGRGASPARLLLSLSATRAKALNIGADDGVEVMIGEGEHHGLLRIRKNNSAGVCKAELVNASKGEYFALRLGHQGAFVNRSESACWCQWEQVEEGWCEIALPKWADETAPRKAEKVTPSLNAPAAPRPKQSVTASLMGDPPPGRRQMLEKFDCIAGRGK